MYREKLSRYFIIPLRLLLKNKKIKKKKENSINQRFSLFYYSIVGHLLKTKKQKKKRKKEKFNQSTFRAGRNKVLCELCQRGGYAQEISHPQIRHSCVHIHVAIYSVTTQ